MDYLKSFGISAGEGNYHEEAFYSLILVYNVLFTKISQALQEWGLTPSQFNILMVVNKEGNGAGISQVDLSKKLIVTPSNTARLLEKMEAQKLIVRSPLPQDKRVKRVFITPKGAALLEKVWPHFQSKIREAASALCDEDQKAAAAVLLKWLSKLIV